MNIIEQLEKEQAEKIAEKRPVPDFRPGDTVVVAVRVKEGERSRIQNFEGVVIARSGSGLNESFTVRKISYGEGVRQGGAHSRGAAPPRGQAQGGQRRQMTCRRQPSGGSRTGVC